MNKQKVFEEVKEATFDYATILESIVYREKLTVDEANLIQETLKHYFPVLRDRIVRAAKPNQEFARDFTIAMNKKRNA